MNLKKIGKKIEKNLKNAQICAILLLIFAGGYLYSDENRNSSGNLTLRELRQRMERLETENAVLRSENAALRRELIETLNKYSTQAGKIKRLQAGVSGTIETLEPVYMDVRSMELAEDLAHALREHRGLSVSVLSVTDDLLQRLPDLIKDDVELAKLRLSLEKLRREGSRGIMFTEPRIPPERVSECRILEIEYKTGIVILDAGYLKGVRRGMVFERGGTELQVIALRNFASACLVRTGKADTLSAGDLFKLQRTETLKH